MGAIARHQCSSAFYVGQASPATWIGAATQDHQHSPPCRATRGGHRALHGDEGPDQESDARLCADWAKHGLPDQCIAPGYSRPAQPGAGRQSGILELLEKRTRPGAGEMSRSWSGLPCSCPARLRPSSTAIRSMSMRDHHQSLDSAGSRPRQLREMLVVVRSSRGIAGRFATKAAIPSSASSVRLAATIDSFGIELIRQAGFE